MIINAPLLIYSLGLLISLYHFDNELQLPWYLSLLSLLSSTLKVLCWIPIVATLGIVVWDALTLRSNSDVKSHLYDSDGNKVECDDINHLSFLPDKDYCTKEEYTLKQNEIEIEIEIETKRKTLQPETTDTIPLPSQKASWALVTGASQGIGRSICISLARRKIPVIMVARNLSKLNLLEKEIRDNYGVTAIPIQCDLSKIEQVDALIETLQASTPNYSNSKTRLIDDIDILINNAGLGHSSSFFQNNNNNNNNNKSNPIETMIHLNILGTTKLTQTIGQSMKDSKHHKNQGGRILFVSSIMGAFPGVPGSTVYAATKAYQRSLCVALGRELELELELESNKNNNSQRNISVTCVLPGGVRNTNFATASQMTESAIFHLLPGWGLALMPQQVAEATVRAAISGTKRELYIGWIYNLYAILLVHIVPARLQVILAGIFCGNKKTFEFQSTTGRRLSKILMPNSNTTHGHDDDDDSKKND